MVKMPISNKNCKDNTRNEHSSNAACGSFVASIGFTQVHARFDTVRIVTSFVVPRVLGATVEMNVRVVLEMQVEDHSFLAKSGASSTLCRSGKIVDTVTEMGTVAFDAFEAVYSCSYYAHDCCNAKLKVIHRERRTSCPETSVLFEREV